MPANDNPVGQPAPPPGTDSRILRKLLDRLFASLVNGPSLNCRPHSSRQRIDFTQLAKLGDGSPEKFLRLLLGADREATVSAKIAAPRGRVAFGKQPEDEDEEALSPEERAKRQAFREQQTVLSKLRAIAEDSRTYENDTGVHVLQIGFPLLSLPPNAAGGFGVTRRILAPLAFVSLAVTVKAGPTPSVHLECRNEGADLIVPNTALLAWLERQTGQTVGELLDDETGEKPWAEIGAIAKRVCELMQVALPADLAADEMPEAFKLAAAPRADEDEEPKPSVIAAAVVGLFPLANQGLLRDMQALVSGEQAVGPIESFIKAGVSLEAAPAEEEGEIVEKRIRDLATERLVTRADPCQARAVLLAKSSRGLVMHGPPGTGKSQTISNIIGDHLARGERVLFVCDKRTALDVVINRLDGMGLGGLCGIVHDPQRDQRELYKSIREQLDALPELRSEASAEGKLKKLDAELQSIHNELTTYHAALMKRPDADSLSFHELMGRWLATPADAGSFDAALSANVTFNEMETHTQALSDLLDRAAQAAYPRNPWRIAAGHSLDAFLTTPLTTWRSQLDAFVQACTKLDATIDSAIPPLPANGDPDAIAAARTRLADELERVRATTPAELRSRWAIADARRMETARARLADAAAPLAAVSGSALDRELLATVQAALPTMPQLAEEASILEAYLASTKRLFGFLAFGHKRAARTVLAKYGQSLRPDAAVRVAAFVSGLRARIMLRDALARLDPAATVMTLPDDDSMLASARESTAVISLLASLHTDATVSDLREVVTRAIAATDPPTDLLRGMRATAGRVAAIGGVMTVSETALFARAGTNAGPVQKQIDPLARGGQPVAPIANALTERFDTIEAVLRVRDGLATIPPALRPAVEKLVELNLDSASGLPILRKSVDTAEITRRLASNRILITADAQKLKSSFARYSQLDADKRDVARAAIVHRWATRQKERLLAATGSRLNTLGADLRRRLALRGDRAMRLRQVISVGHGIEGGDPLYDLRPIWMASPETVAQIFPRQPMFDVVIFDEASQCRLEEALPVLLRAKRVVIAGDPKQLPPTRFFESAVAASDEEAIETEQQLFESQQGEIEDLLAAALNIEIDECYLDVHYRSRNADLIEFSNEHFYGSRLQAIPGHPQQRTQLPPIKLYRADGVYEKRENEIEAAKVCEIVRELLKREKPPSVGIACFNISQRDLIVEKLEELAETDTAFAKAFAAARERRSKDSFEGLFVKNLENVQGDERDHMIISTTYGPDAKGKFYRRFGPVGSVGGGRRLNVLVTRAREEVHLVTSIPETVYRNLPQVPTGETPGGAWLLFAYLVYAEKLAEEYALNARLSEQVQATHEAAVNEKPTRFPSDFARYLARQLHAQHKLGSDVHWGNDGFCVDVALHHPTRAEDVSVGVLCDLNRFERAADAVEWEAFRTGILEGQGWKLTRVWTPHFFRDQAGATAAIVREATAINA